MDPTKTPVAQGTPDFDSDDDTLLSPELQKLGKMMNTILIKLLDQAP